MGTSKAKIETAKNALYQLDFVETTSIIKYAAIMKFIITSICAEAVSDCLQVFGGYGYMEDSGIEKNSGMQTRLPQLEVHPYL